MRHHAGRSSLTEISRLLTSSALPGDSGAIAERMISNSPLPQSRSPPSQTASAGGKSGSVIAPQASSFPPVRTRASKYEVRSPERLSPLSRARAARASAPTWRAEAPVRRPLVADAGGAGGEELDELRAADDGRSG